MARGAQAGHLDMRHPHGAELDGVRPPQVEVRGVGGTLLQQSFGVDDGGAQRLDDVRPDLVATRADGGPDARPNVLGTRAERFAHSAHRLGGDAARRPLPPRVRQADGMVLGVVQPDGDAIGKAQHQQHVGGIGDQGVGGLEGTPYIGVAHPCHAVAMHLPGGHHAGRIDPQGSIDGTVVGGHRRRVIADMAADIQAGERLSADAAETCEGAVYHRQAGVRGEGIPDQPILFHAQHRRLSSRALGLVTPHEIPRQGRLRWALHQVGRGVEALALHGPRQPAGVGLGA